MSDNAGNNASIDKATIDIKDAINAMNSKLGLALSFFILQK